MKMRNTFIPWMQRTQQGFTLIELMIVVSIIGVLMSFAVPAYNDSVMKANRTDSTSMLTAAASLQEQFYLDNKVYTVATTDLGYPSGTLLTENGAYTVTVVDEDLVACPLVTCFVMQAVPVSNGPQVNDSCGTMTLASNGVGSPAECW